MIQILNIDPAFSQAIGLVVIALLVSLALACYDEGDVPPAMEPQEPYAPAVDWLDDE